MYSPKHLSFSKANFYATCTTYAHYIPLCARANLHGFKKLLSVNKLNGFKQKKDEDNQREDRKGKNLIALIVLRHKNREEILRGSLISLQYLRYSQILIIGSFNIAGSCTVQAFTKALQR